MWPGFGAVLSVVCGAAEPVEVSAFGVKELIGLVRLSVLKGSKPIGERGKLQARSCDTHRAVVGSFTESVLGPALKRLRALRLRIRSGIPFPSLCKSQTSHAPEPGFLPPTHGANVK